MKTNTIQFKVGILYTGILGAILLVYSLIVIGILQHTLSRDIDKQLEVKTHEVAALVDSLVKIRLGSPTYHVTAFSSASQRIMELHRMNYAGAVNALETRILEMMDRYELHDDYFSITNAEGRLIASSQNTPPELRKMLLEKIILNLKQGERFSTLKLGSKQVRLITARIQLPQNPSYFIQIASSLSAVDKASQKLFFVILFILPATIFLTGFTGRILVSKILKPVRAVARAAESVTHEDLGHRVQVKHADAEMQELMLAFNHMIERLEKAFGHISEFSTHVAHELKTPLAVIRGEAELALRKDRSPAEYREALEANLREAARMVRIIDDMLLLARVDYDPQSLSFQPLDLKLFLQDILEKELLLADKKQIRIQALFTSEKIMIQADELHLRRLFFNIFENALKFTPPRGEIKLHLETQDQKTLVQISDSGPGIPPDEIPKIFDKFFHKDRNSGEAGNGLGLSIALSIAKAHQGTISIESPSGRGATFTVTLPLLVE